MKVNGYEERTTKVRQECQDGNPYDIPRSMGDVPDYGSEYGDDQIGTFGEDSKRESRRVLQSASNPSGGIISQLIKETKEQLAYHNQQIEFHQEQSQTVGDKLNQLLQVYNQLKDNE